MPHRLGEICKLMGGYAYSSRDFCREGVPVIKIGDVTGGGRIDYSGMDCVSVQNAIQTRRFSPEPGDTLIAMTGANVGKTIRVGAGDPDARINQRVGRFVPVIGSEYSKEYIYFLVRNPLAFGYFSNAAYGSAQPNISGDLIENLPIPDIEPAEANRLAAVLGSLDNKIDLNHRMNETLETMARAIFKDWFVDFGPTRAKMEGRAPYLSPDVWPLFSDRLDDDDKPEGWKLETLSSVAHLVRTTVNPSLHPSEIFDHYSIPAYDSGKYPIREVGAGILSNKTVIPDGAVLLSKLNPEIPRIWLVDTEPSTRSIGSTEFLVLLPNLDWMRPFLYCSLTDQGFGTRLQAMVTGTSKSHQRVSPDSVMAIPIVIATQSVFRSFSNVISSLVKKMTENRRESRTLAQTRDLLLPKLMSGEIRIKDAEKVVETVL
jgi:type I restriction enzyme S subunit